MDQTWRAGLERRLEPFSAGLAHCARRVMLPLYISGLIDPGDRKSVQPMAARDVAVSHDQMHRFIAVKLRDSAPLAAALLRAAGRLVAGQVERQ